MLAACHAYTNRTYIKLRFISCESIAVCPECPLALRQPHQHRRHGLRRRADNRATSPASLPNAAAVGGARPGLRGEGGGGRRRSMMPSGSRPAVGARRHGLGQRGRGAAAAPRGDCCHCLPGVGGGEGPRGWVKPCCHNIIADYSPYIPWTQDFVGIFFSVSAPL